MSDPMSHRLMGGSPLGVLVRLVVVSLLVGALMSWLEIDPEALFDWVRACALHLWSTGFRSLHEVGRYILTGAAVVVPVWLLMRLTSIGARPPARPTGPSRWTLPGSPDRGDAGGRIRTEPRD